MAKSKIPRDSGGGGGSSSEWLNTYADMVTLLMTFFVLLFSMSTINPVKWDTLVNTYGRVKDQTNSTATEENSSSSESTATVSQDISEFVEELLAAIESAVSAAMSEQDGEGTGGIGENENRIDFSEVYEILLQYIVSNDLQEKVGLDKSEDFVMIRFKDRAFFASGQATLTSSSLEIIRYVADSIMLVLDQVEDVVVTGHTDTVPQNSWEFHDNWDLGGARANAVVKCLIAYEIPGEKIVSQNRGEFDPIGDNDTPEGRSENRRVEVKVTRIKGEDAIDYVPPQDETADGVETDNGAEYSPETDEIFDETDGISEVEGIN